MQKIINDPSAFVDEMLDGVLLAHPEDLRRTRDPVSLSVPMHPGRTRWGS